MERGVTVETYNNSARELSEYFRGIGSRVHDIDIAFQLAGNPSNPSVLEIGCGDGRDAIEITQRTNRYIGFDISEGMITIAQEQVPSAQFEVADAIDFSYFQGLDIVFAFASLLHLPPDEVKQVFEQVAENLNPGGIFFVSLKYAHQYAEIVKEDQFGTRLFYLYNPQIIEELAGDCFQTVYLEHSIKGGTEWIEIALRKGATY